MNRTDEQPQPEHVHRSSQAAVRMLNPECGATFLKEG
jgi:hypothetical protein